MYVMGEKVGHAVLPVERPQAGNWTQKVVKPVDAPLATKGKPQTHEVSIGENEEVAKIEGIQLTEAGINSGSY